MLFRFGMAILRLCLNPIQTSRTGRLSSQEGQDKPELWCGRKRAQFAVEQIQIGYFNGFPRIGVFGGSRVAQDGQASPVGTNVAVVA